MKILVFQARDRSLKATLLSLPTEKILFEAHITNIGLAKASYQYALHLQDKTLPFSEIDSYDDHEHAVQAIFHTLIEYDISTIDCIAHHVVHGGTKYVKPTLITESVIHQLHDLSQVANENASCLLVILASQKIVPTVKHIAVFDTAFHQTILPQNTMYAIPKEYRENGVRKYGFHGVAHLYAAKSSRKLLLAKDQERYLHDYNIIHVHSNGGVSICAMHNGQSMNISSGFGTVSGPPFGTRCGDIDAAALAYMAKRSKKSAEQILSVLQKKSGFYSVSHALTLVDLKKEADEGNSEAEIVLEKFLQDTARQIAGFVCDIGRVDAIAFSGEIVQPWVITAICEKLSFLNVSVQKRFSTQFTDVIDITGPESAVNVFAICVKEYLEVAKEAKHVCDSL